MSSDTQIESLLEMLRSSLNEPFPDSKLPEDLQSEQVAIVRAHFWNLQLLIRQQSTDLKELYSQIAKAQDQRDALKLQGEYLEAEISRLRATEFSYENLDLVDLDQFKADNPEFDVENSTSQELTLARIEDEKKRRARLFFHRLEVQKDKKDLEAKLQDLKGGLQLRGKPARILERLHQDMATLDKEFKPKDQDITEEPDAEMD